MCLQWFTMLNFLSDTVAYISAILGHTVTLLAGCGATVVLGLIQKYILKRPLSVKWELIMFSGFVFFAGFQAWQDQRNSYNAAQEQLHKDEKKLAALTQPQLHISLGLIARAPAGIHGDDCLVTITAVITNTGAPSVAEFNDATIKMSSGDTKNTVLLPTHEKVILYEGSDSSSKHLEFGPSDWLPKMAFQQPIPTGGGVRGYFQLIVKGLNKEQLEGSVVRVVVSDVNDKKYTAEASLSGTLANIPDIDEIERQNRKLTAPHSKHLN